MKNITLTCLSLFAALMFFASCKERVPFVEEKVALQNIGTDCSKKTSTMGMISNAGGERFEFEKCLPANFNKEVVKAERRGDTIVVDFRKAVTEEPNTLFKITLDVDSYPEYHNLSIDGDNFTISAVK